MSYSGVINTDVLLDSTATAPASEGEAVVQSPTKKAVTKIAAVDFIDLY